MLGILTFSLFLPFQDFAHSHVDVFVACPMKSVFAQMVLGVELVGDGVAMGILRNGAVVGRVEDGDLLQGGKQTLQDTNAYKKNKKIFLAEVLLHF